MVRRESEPLIDGTSTIFTVGFRAFPASPERVFRISNLSFPVCFIAAEQS
jgi:hypothetical protein